MGESSILNRNKKAIILLGPPGAGKGTQAELLSKKFNFYYIETSRILENYIFNTSDKYLEIDGEKFSIEKEKENFQNGILITPKVVTYLMVKSLKKIVKLGLGIVLAGSPRTTYECEKIIPTLIDLFGKENIRVALIDLSPEGTIYRNSHRRICSLSRHPILYSEETKNLTRCPLDGSLLVKRGSLDSPDVIKTRLEQYKTRTVPLLKCIEGFGIKTAVVNGDQTPSEVFDSLLSALSL